MTQTKRRTTQWPFAIEDFAVFTDDFFRYRTADWQPADVTNVTVALQAGSGGLIRFTTTNSATAVGSLQTFVNSFRPVANKRLFFKTRLRVSDVDQTALVAGLIIDNANPFNTTPPTDGIYFYSDDGSSNIGLKVAKDSTVTTVANLVTLSDNTFVNLEFAYDGVNSIRVFADGEELPAVSAVNVPDDQDVCGTLGLANGEAAVNTMDVDLFQVGVER